MPFKNFRNESRQGYGRELCPTQELTRDDLKLGAVLRIADACELMAKNHQELIADRDFYKKQSMCRLERTQNLDHQIAGLRGYITRLKKAKKK